MVKVKSSIRYKYTNPVPTGMISTIRKAPRGPAPPGYLPGTSAGQGLGLLISAQLAQNPRAVTHKLGQKMAALNASMKQSGASAVLDNFMTGQGSKVSKVDTEAGKPKVKAEGAEKSE